MQFRFYYCIDQDVLAERTALPFQVVYGEIKAWIEGCRQDFEVPKEVEVVRFRVWDDVARKWGSTQVL